MTIKIPHNEEYEARNWLNEPISQIYTRRIGFIKAPRVLDTPLATQFYNLSDEADAWYLCPDLSVCLGRFVQDSTVKFYLFDHHCDQSWPGRLETMGDLFVALGHMKGTR